MTKKLSALLELAVVIVGLAVAPSAVVASLASVVSIAPAVTVAQDVAAPVLGATRF